MICKLIILLSFVAIFSRITEGKCKNRNNKFYARQRSSSSCECGISEDETAFESRIIGGKEVKSQSKYPWMVAIYTLGKMACGGSLIARTFVLTAAHCFQRSRVLQPIDPQQKKCRLENGEILSCFGKFSLYGIRVGQKYTDVINILSFPIHKYIIHPKYNITTHVNDVALVQVKTKNKCSKNFRPVCLPKNMPVPKEGTKVIITGWGNTVKNKKYDLTSKFLKEARTRIKSKDECEDVMTRKKGVPPGTHICAQQASQGVCLYDSGGPLFAAVNKKFYVFGITAFTVNDDCDPKDPQFFSDVTVALDWIEKNIYSE